jgi:transposase
MGGRSRAAKAGSNAVEPHAYLADVLTRLVNGHPNSRIDDLLPWAYVA